MKVYHILSDHKLFNKICQRINSDYKCVEAFDCGSTCPTCPAWVMREVERLMNTKGLTAGEAYRMTQRGSVSLEDALKVIQEIREGKRFYPESCPLCKRVFGEKENGDESTGSSTESRSTSQSP